MVLDLGFQVGIDTDCCRAGWLTAFEVRTGGIVQANQSGAVHYSSGRELKAGHVSVRLVGWDRDWPRVPAGVALPAGG